MSSSRSDGTAALPAEPREFGGGPVADAFEIRQSLTNLLRLLLCRFTGYLAQVTINLDYRASNTRRVSIGVLLDNVTLKAF